MQGPSDAELRRNPLFTAWVGADEEGLPLHARLRLEGLGAEAEKRLGLLAAEFGLEASAREGAGGAPRLWLLAGQGAALRRFAAEARALGGEAAEAGEAAGAAFEGYRAFLSGTMRLSPRVTVDPERPQVWGVLNPTPDSFSDGGRFADPGAALAQAERMAAEGAAVIDVGGESTRPGSAGVDAEEERRRVVPLIARIREALGVPVSVDTSKAAVAREALQAGAEIVNDVTGLAGDPGMARAIAEAGAGAVLMHMRGTPRTMQADPRYADLPGEIARFLRNSLRSLADAGGGGALVDPGIGFGKSVDHNLRLVAGAGLFGALGRPVLLGPSRKSFLGAVLDLPVGERLEGTAAAVACAVLSGAAVLRVHDVREMVRVARVAAAVRRAWRENA
jgi:dihydropteroate synthase